MNPNFKVDDLVITPNGKGFVWEIYPTINKVGVQYFNDSRIRFYRIDQISYRKPICLGDLYKESVRAISAEYHPGFENSLEFSQLMEWKKISTLPTNNLEQIKLWRTKMISFLKKHCKKDICINQNKKGIA